MLRTAFIALAALAAAVPNADAQQAPLTIEISGLAPQGAILLAVFDSEAGYDGGGQGVAQRRAEVTGDSVSIIIPDLAPGRYAFRVFHDVNGNGRMDTNPFGMPIEPFAFSNNARGQFGPARWADAVFTVGVGGVVQQINLGAR